LSVVRNGPVTVPIDVVDAEASLTIVSTLASVNAFTMSNNIVSRFVRHRPIYFTSSIRHYSSQNYDE
jgi:hypothetical protein